MSRSYFNKLADVWDNTATEKDRVKLEKMAERIEIEQGDKILDVGCGTGIFLPFLARKTRFYEHIYAIDIAEEMLFKSVKKYARKDAVFIQADIIYSPFGKCSFDAVVCYSSFPHFNNKEASLLEMRRILKDKGVLYICHTADRLTINERHSGIPEVRKDVLPSGPELSEMFERAGFMNISIEDNEDCFFARASKY